MHSRPSLHAASLLTLLTPLTSAIITGIHLPSKIAPNSTVPVTIITHDYIQRVEDIAIAFGIAAASTAISSNESVGSTVLRSLYLGPEKSNILGNISTTVEIPGDVPAGEAVFNGVLYSLYGAVYEPVLKNFTVGVVVESR